ncbi:uncharacterized protein [Musca autumnalis]|uniref:uncharacterized protein n=1 Tax=Musca autumnalis TaxID=221902 RepID=UPI003CF0D612
MEVQVKRETVVESEDESDQYPTQLIPNVQMMVKEEEIIIDNNYNDGYQEQQGSYQVEGFSIHFMDDNDNDGYLDEDSDEDVFQHEDEASDTDNEPETSNTNSASTTKSENNENGTEDVYKQIENLLSQDLIRMLCPICKVSIKRFNMWSRHINKFHSKLSQEIKEYFEYHTSRVATCKHCCLVLTTLSTHYLHYLSIHCKERRLVFVCRMCKRKLVNITAILDHMKENHKQMKEVNFAYCPLTSCGLEFPEQMLMKLHFMDIHNKEYKSKFGFFTCPLCNHPRFARESQYYDHLMNLHGLCDHNWEKLNFVQNINSHDGEKQFECLQCSQIFVDTGTHKLLEHYLVHNEDFLWFCSYCQSKLTYKESMHFCDEMYSHFTSMESDEEEHLPTTSTSTLAPSSSYSLLASTVAAVYESAEWKSFESYICHICPFCEQDFITFKSWQLHLKQAHHINTLEGLRLVDNGNTFLCIDCSGVLDKSSKDIHLHRFTHLPHLPYRCLKCSRSIGDLETAIKHFQTKCGEDIDSDQKPITHPEFSHDELNWIEIFCPKCKKLQFFSSKEDIDEHLNRFHNSFLQHFYRNPNSIDMVCKKCKSTIRSVDSEICLNHYIKHIRPGPYRCLICQRCYRQLDIIQRHVRRFHGIGMRVKRSLQHDDQGDVNTRNKIVKASAPKPRKRKSRAKNDATTSTPEIVNNGLGTFSNNATILNEFENFISYACAECNQSFDMPKEWNEHVTKEHTFFNESELSVYDATKGKQKCKHCNLILTTSLSHRQKHKLTHMPYRSFVCNICDNRCCTLGLLYGHLRRNHFRKGNFECPICLVNLTTAYERSEHVNKTHPRSEWPASMCLICYRKYGSLAAHMASHDLNRPKHICPVCGTGIINYNDIRKHVERKHSIQDSVGYLAKFGIGPATSANAAVIIKREAEEVEEDDQNTSDTCSSQVCGATATEQRE